MTIAPLGSPPLAASRPPPAAADRPLLHTVERADDGDGGTGAGSTLVDGFVVEWQLGAGAGGRR